MKKKVTLVLIICIISCLFTGCTNTFDIKPAKIELTVFAAASLTEALTELGEKYEAEHENIDISFNFDSSGTLKTQIDEGAQCDIFISAAQKQMNELDAVLEESRFDILENKVALTVPEGNPANIQSLEDMAQKLKDGEIMLAMGNSDVPVGQYTQEILKFFELSEDELAQKGCITYGTNVKEVTSQVSEGTVDCGIVYSTDAFSAGLTVIDTASEEMCSKVVYPACVIASSVHPKEAQEFLDFLKSDVADDIFKSIGFLPYLFEKR